MIQEAIAKNLASKGVSRAADAGDITVAYPRRSRITRPRMFAQISHQILR